MGRLELNEPFVQQSIIETKFTGRIVKALDIGGFMAAFRDHGLRLYHRFHRYGV